MFHFSIYTANVVWENETFTFAKKIFRQINSLAIYLVKPLLSRNLCQKCVRVNSRNIYTVISYLWTVKKLRFENLNSMKLISRKIRYLQYSVTGSFVKSISVNSTFQTFFLIHKFKFSSYLELVVSRNFLSFSSNNFFT